MFNSIAAGRRLAWRAVTWQAAASVLVALAFLAGGPPSALAALAGGGAVALGGLAAMWVALGGGVGSAGVAFARLLMGLTLKWLLVAVALVIALAVLKLPGIPLVAGVVAAMLALLLAHSIMR